MTEQGHEPKVYGGGTPIVRSEPSVPMARWRELGLLIEPVLDFGSGWDHHEFVRYDPFITELSDPRPLLGSWQTITCNYVLNVQPSDHLVTLIAFTIRGALRPGGRALFAIRNDLPGGWTDQGYQMVKWLDDWRALLLPAFHVEVFEQFKFIGLVCRRRR